MASEFTKGQNPDVLFQRERALGAELLNKSHYTMWLELAARLGMGPSESENIATYRQFMQTGSSTPRVDRQSRDRSRGRFSHDRSSSRGRPQSGYRRDEPGPSRRRSPSGGRSGPDVKRGRSGSYMRR